MKKLSLLILFIATTAIVYSQISTTAHNFTAEAWNTMASNKACGPCHTPHNSLASIDAPLWSHTATASVFTIYAGTGTLDATDIGQPGGVSLKCLSCHDGTVNLNNHIAGANSASLMIGSAMVGTDLSNDHPISFTYDDALSVTDPGLHPPTTTASGITANIDDDLLFGALNNQMECSSCHDPHGVIGVSMLLRRSNTNSELCLTCHNK